MLFLYCVSCFYFLARVNFFFFFLSCWKFCTSGCWSKARPLLTFSFNTSWLSSRYDVGGIQRDLTLLYLPPDVVSSNCCLCSSKSISLVSSTCSCYGYHTGDCRTCTSCCDGDRLAQHIRSRRLFICDTG